MQAIKLSDYKNKDVKLKLQQIPFFSDVAAHSQQELTVMLENSKVINLDKGEVLVDKGEFSRCFYVLLEGELDVFPGRPGDLAIGQIVGAQIFAALGTINDDSRTATLVASRTCAAQVLAIDYKVFGNLDDFSKISLKTKLHLYTNVVNNTRYKLEQIYRETEDMELYEELQLFKSHQGEKNTLLHLQILASQAKGLGILLEACNEKATPSIRLPEITEEPTAMGVFMANVRNFLKKVI